VRRARGFTLIELIAVLALIGLLLAFSPLALNSMVAERELEAEVTRLGSMIEMIRVQAVLDQADFAIHYDLDDNRWAVQIPQEITEESEDPDEEPVTRLVLEKEVDPADLDWHELPAQMELEFYEGRRRQDNGRWRVVFNPKGTVPPHTIVMKSNRIQSLVDEERMRTIKVNFPGFVSFAPGRVIDDFKKSEAELGR
jgi:prepilin-type N-terminal cleavage/methylation domain-containing protein